MVSIRSSHYFSQVILLKDKKHFISRRELPPILTMTLPVGSFSSAQRRKLVKAGACTVEPKMADWGTEVALTEEKA